MPLKKGEKEARRLAEMGALQKEHEEQVKIVSKDFNLLVGEKVPEGITSFEMQLRVSYQWLSKEYVEKLECLKRDLELEKIRFLKETENGNHFRGYVSASGIIQGYGGRIDSLGARIHEVKELSLHYLAHKNGFKW